MAKISSEVAQQLIDENNLKTVDDIQDMLKNMFGPVLENMLKAEMNDHLGYTKHDQSQKPTNNRRNGNSKKTVKSDYGELEINIPRDRNGEFEPVVVKKDSKDISGISDMVLSMYAKGMSTRDMEDYLRDLYGINASHSLISDIIDRVTPEVKEWQNRPLEKVYAIVYMDAIHFPVRQDGSVINKAVYIAIGISLSGQKDVLGIWVSKGAETSKYWLNILNELKNRGIDDILIIATDNLAGFSEAIKSAFPKTEIQKCIIHQIRNSTKYLSYKDRKEFCTDLKAIYKAPTEDSGLLALEKVDEKWGKKYPLSIKSWYNNWGELSTFFKYPQEIRTIIYTTNTIESYNRKLRKITKSKGSFPTDNALLKLLYLVTMDSVKKWTTSIRNWPVIISQLSIYFEDRLEGQIF
jgi:putative transposase